jgi:hypothetical protein
MNTTLFEAVHADPWAERLIDLPSLNADASGTIEEAIVRQRDVARTKPKELRSFSLVVLGPPGAGKTHLFARLRQRLGPKAAFVHVRPLLNSEMTARFVLHEIAKQLGYATLGLRQVDALVGSLLAHLGGAPSSFPSTFLEEFARLDDPERVRRLEEVLERVLGIWQDLDESYLRRLLSVPFGPPSMQRAAMAWLSGRECDDVQLARLGASSSLEEAAVVPAMRTLAAVASLGAPIVLVFDQLENLIDGDESKLRLLAYANLAAELVDSARGVVLVHMAIDTEWTRALEPALGESHRSRIAMRKKSLSLPTAIERQALLRLWAERVPNPIAPFPWPFGERRVARLCSAPGMTPRMMLVECRLTLEEGGIDEPPPEDATLDVRSLERRASQDGADAVMDALAAEWEKQVDAARLSLDEMAQQGQCADPARIADGFSVASGFVPPLAVEINLREPAQLTWWTASGKVRMALLHQNHPRSLGVSLAKLATLAEKEPVLALRERTHDLPPTWKDTLAKRAAFVAKRNAQWVPLEREDAARLLALASLLTAARSGDVTDSTGREISLEAVRRWASDALEIPAWPILAAVTARPGEAIDDPVAPVGVSVPSLPGVTMSVLLRLRVASMDRLLREVARIDRTVTRSSTLLDLERARDRVQWIGTAVVCVKGDP